MVVYYLHHDALRAARFACDAHLWSGAHSAVQLLSNAWHELNGAYLPLESNHPYAALFASRTPPARSGQPERQTSAPDPLYAEFSGDKRYWLLMGQRIGGYMHAEHPNCVWARASTGNYLWVHAWGTECAREYQFRTGKRHPATPTLWTLEALPPHLMDGSDQTEPMPVVPHPVVVDGCYDAVQSYREYYVNHKQPMLKYTRRDPPPWLVLDSSGVYTLSSL